MKNKALLSIVGRCIVFVATLFMSCAPEKDAVVKLTQYEVKQGYEEQLRKALSDYVLHSLRVESNIMVEAYYEQKTPSVLWLIERSKSRNDLNKSGIKSDLVNSGGTVVDEPVVTDGNLITSRHPIDVADFSRAVVEWLSKY